MLVIKSPSILKMLKSKIFPFVCTQTRFVQSILLSNYSISLSDYFVSRPSLFKNLDFLNAIAFALFMSFSIGFNCFYDCSSFLPSIFFNVFRRLSFLSFFPNPLLKTLPYGESSNLACSTTPGLHPKSSPLKYSYLSNSLDDNEEVSAATLSKLY